MRLTFYLIYQNQPDENIIVISFLEYDDLMEFIKDKNLKSTDYTIFRGKNIIGCLRLEAL